MLIILWVMQILHLARRVRHFYSPCRRDSHENSANPWPKRHHQTASWACRRLHRSRLTMHDLTSRQPIGVSCISDGYLVPASLGPQHASVSMDANTIGCSFLHGLILTTRPLDHRVFVLPCNSKTLHMPFEILSARTISVREYVIPFYIILFNLFT